MWSFNKTVFHLKERGILFAQFMLIELPWHGFVLIFVDQTRIELLGDHL